MRPPRVSSRPKVGGCSRVVAGIGILGGTFDPVHCGHLRLAVEVRERLGLDAVRLLPAAAPRLRAPPAASAAERREMLYAAVAGIPELVVDERELGRTGPTCTVDTLGEMRRAYPREPLCFVLGLDAFLRLDAWERWEEIPALAHLAIAPRAGVSLPRRGPLARLLDERGTGDPAALRRAPAGLVHVADLPAFEVSASQVRRRLAQGRSVHRLVPPAVLDLIERHGSYRPCKQND